MKISLLGIAVLGLASQASAGLIVVGNSGFELPDLGAGGNAYQYPGHGGAPTIAQQGGTGFTFVGGSGIAANGSAFGVTGATNGNSDGTTSTSGQVGLIQGGDGTTTGNGAVYFSQTLSGFEAGTATVTFSAEARNGQNGANPFMVTLDGTALTFGTSTTVTPASNSAFTAYTSTPISVTAGSHTLDFIGTGSSLGDVTSFIDNVAVTNVATPEPASLGLLGLGGVALLGRRRRSSSAH